MHSEDNLTVMSHYSHIIEEITMFIHFHLNFIFWRLCFTFSRLVTFEYVYMWWCLCISTQEALFLIPKLKQSHQTGCLATSFTVQLSIMFVCQPSCLYMLFIKWLHLLSKPTYCLKHKVRNASEIMQRNSKIMLYMAVSSASTLQLKLMLATRL